MYIYNISSYLQQCKHYKNPSRFSRVMITNVLPPFYGSQCISENGKCCLNPNVLGCKAIFEIVNNNSSSSSYSRPSSLLVIKMLFLFAQVGVGVVLVKRKKGR